MTKAPLQCTLLVLLVVTGACGRREQFATLPKPIYGMTLRDGAVFVIDISDSVWLVPTDGRAPRRLRQGSSSPHDGQAPVVTADSVIWVDDVYDPILAIGRDGGAERTLATTDSLKSYPAEAPEVAGDDGAIYWTTHYNTAPPHYPDYRATLSTLPLDGGAPSGLLVIDGGYLANLAVAAGRVFVTRAATGGTAIISLAADGTDVQIVKPAGIRDPFTIWNGSVFWVSGGEIHRRDLASGADSLVASLPGTVRWVGADDAGTVALSSVCTLSAEPAVMSCTERVFSGATQVAQRDYPNASGYPAASKVAFDQQWIYWAPMRPGYLDNGSATGDIFRVHR